MRKIYKIKVYLLAVVLLATSCNKFLEVTPDNRLRLDSYDKIAELVANAYPEMDYVFLETMSDNVGDCKFPEADGNAAAYRWEEVLQESQSTPVAYWNACYLAIAHANHVLAALDELTVTDIDRHNAIKGEALACRAYAHFMLVNIWAKHYNATTAASDLGIVYFTKPEITLLAEYERGTVAETYRLIEEDLHEALKLVTNKYYKNTGKYHFRREALYAFASRLYLFKGDWLKCIEYSSILLGSGGYDPSYVRDFATVLAGASSDVRGEQYQATSLKANLLTARFQVGTTYWFHVGYRLNPTIADEIKLTSGDLRLPMYENSTKSTLFVPKFNRSYFYQEDITSNSGFPWTVKALFRSEETVLNRIEAYLKADQVSLAESDLNKYLNAAYSAAPYNNYVGMKDYYTLKFPELTGNNLMEKIIIDERRRDLIEEGLRWFDIKRFSLPVTHIDSRGGTHILTEDDVRKVLPIPRAAVDFGGLEQNPMPVPSAEKAFLKIITD